MDNKKKACRIDGVSYDSIADAMRDMGVSYGTARRYARWGSRVNPDKESIRMKECEIDGVSYDSITDAMKSIGVSYETARRYSKWGSKVNPKSRPRHKPLVWTQVDGVWKCECVFGTIFIDRKAKGRYTTDVDSHVSMHATLDDAKARAQKVLDSLIEKFTDE